MATNDVSRTCRKCGETKPLSHFEKRAGRSLGHTFRCGDCTTEYKTAWAIRTNQQERRSEYFARYNASAIAKKRKAEWKRRNPEYNAAINKAWRQKNPRKQVLYMMNYYKRYPHLVHARNAFRKAWKLKATPRWADKNKIKAFYEEASRRTRETGIRHSVDHIIPLRSPIVCGLHVENNLRVLTFSENSKKYNAFLEELIYELSRRRDSSHASERHNSG